MVYGDTSSVLRVCVAETDKAASIVVAVIVVAAAAVVATLCGRVVEHSTEHGSPSLVPRGFLALVCRQAGRRPLPLLLPTSVGQVAQGERQTRWRQSDPLLTLAGRLAGSLDLVVDEASSGVVSTQSKYQ